MKLNLLKSLSNLLSKGKSKSLKTPVITVDPAVSGTDYLAIVIQENKNNVLIQCWRDGKETWVKKGSFCHKHGVCSKCSGEIKLAKKLGVEI